VGSHGRAAVLGREEYAAAHPNESVGAPPLPGNSRLFSERREGYYKSANDFPSPVDPPGSFLSDSVTRNLRPCLGTRSTHSESPEQADLTNVEPRLAWWGTRDYLTPTPVMTTPPLWSTEMRLTTKTATERHRKMDVQ
jgi:hypothetical protein